MVKRIMPCDTVSRGRFAGIRGIGFRRLTLVIDDDLAVLLINAGHGNYFCSMIRHYKLA